MEIVTKMMQMMAIAQMNMRMIILFQVNFFWHIYKRIFFQEYLKNTHYCKKINFISINILKEILYPFSSYDTKEPINMWSILSIIILYIIVDDNASAKLLENKIDPGKSLFYCLSQLLSLLQNIWCVINIVLFSSIL